MVFDPGEDGGLDEEALLSTHSGSSVLQPGSLLLSARYQIHDLVKLLPVNLDKHNTEHKPVKISGALLSVTSEEQLEASDSKGK